MSLLAADSIELQYGGRIIFDGDSIAIDAGDRVGVIGANGTGKSTLMKILAGQLQPDGGRVTRAKGARIGYLAQEHSARGEGSLLDSVLQTAPGRAALEERLLDVERSLSQAAAGASAEAGLLEELGVELADLHATLADLDRFFARHEAERILGGLGFGPEDLGRPVRELSGGWRMRAALAALLFQRPDVLLLDEPTNHLDMPSVHWLDGFLRGFPHALVLISHDKEFLNRHVRRIASLEVEGLRQYKGDYDSYLVQREQELELLENRARRDDARKKELEAFVERFRAKATKARQAQSRVRMIEKLKEQQVDLPRPRRSMALQFEPTARSGERPIVVKALSYAYEHGARPIFSGLDLEVRRGDHIAIVGKNGAGKTTLLKLLAGELEPDGGKIELGHNVTRSYFAQHHAEVLDLQKTVLEEVWRSSPEMSQTKARSICGSFLFSGDDVDKYVGVLSGGEKARVALARLLASPGNLLLLDEPTNHLDTESADKLTDSLRSYDGTLLFVSHNLDFARRLSNKVWDVHDGIVETYPGSLGDYLTHLGLLEAEREGRSAPDLPKGSAPSADAGAGAAGDKGSRKEAYRRAKEVQAEERKKRSSLERRVREAELGIAALEARQKELEAALADPATHGDVERSKALAQEYQEVRTGLERELERWEQAQAALDALGPPTAS